MFFFIAGNKTKLVGQETRKIIRNGFEVNAEISVYKNYLTLFFIPLIPTGKKYTVYIPHTDEFYQTGMFGKMPPDLQELCNEVGRNY